MMETGTFLVTREIAERSGLIETRYRTKDGRFIMNDRDLARIRFTVDEYISGLQGIVKITSVEAQTLIAQNKYQMGIEKKDEEIETNEQEVEE